MTDEPSPWAAPGGSGSHPGADPRPAPQYGEYAPPGWVPPNPGQQGSWTPPPRPGLIPLRPLGLGDVTAAAFQVIRRNPRPTFGFALLISIVVGVVSVLLVGLASVAALGRVDMAASTDVETIRAGGIVLLILGAIAAALIQLAVSALPQGVVAAEVARGTLGERSSLKELWRRVRGRIGALVAWMLIVGCGVVLLLVIVSVPLVQLAVGSGLSGVLLAIGLGFLAGLGVLAFTFWISTKLEFVAPLIIIERLSIAAAVRRSWTMTRGNFWRILGITLLINLIVQVGVQVVSAPIVLLGTFVSVIINPNQTEDAVAVTTLVIGIVSLLVGIVANAIVIVAQSAVPTLLYLDVRMRREGFDVVLQRYAEARAAGRDDEDPFA